MHKKLIVACETGDLDSVNILLKKRNIHPYTWNNKAVRIASERGHIEIVKLLLLSSPKVDPSVAFGSALGNGHREIADFIINNQLGESNELAWYHINAASSKGYIDIVRVLMQNTHNNHRAIIEASENGHAEVVRLLLTDPSNNPGENDNLAIIKASVNGHAEVVRVLLEDRRVDPSVMYNRSKDYAIIKASENGHAEVVKLLLNDSRVNPAAEYIYERHTAYCPSGNNYPIRIASENGHLEVVRLLLENPMVNPAADDNDAICNAAGNGHLEIVQLLLTRENVNPCKHRKNLDYSDAIAKAAHGGHIEVVKLLLEDPRVKPATYDNEPIIRASEKGHAEVVKLLIEKPSVNPAARDNMALRCAVHSGRTEVVKLLLNDSRVNVWGDYSSDYCITISRDNVEIVRELLKYPRISPPASLLFDAVKDGLVNVVTLLLNDHRVDPAADNNKAFNYANQKCKRRDNILELLLSNQQVRFKIMQERRCFKRYFSKFPDIYIQLITIKSIITKELNLNQDTSKIVIEYLGFKTT